MIRPRDHPKTNRTALSRLRTASLTGVQVASHTRSIMTSRVTYLFAYFADTEKVGAVGS